MEAPASSSDNFFATGVEEFEEDESLSLTEYDIITTPNDFNIRTIFDFITSGSVKIPDFQRNFVWDLRRSSKLIESILIGLPIPQVFLYEDTRNRFLVIDGQQRLMSIYYFIKGRFPKAEARPLLRDIFNTYNDIPTDVLEDDALFRDFGLQLPARESGEVNSLAGKKYGTLGDLRQVFDLRTIRNIIIKQTKPEGDDSSIYEIFNRLNSGGVTLKPQEIRTALYHSKFYMALADLNYNQDWRRHIGLAEPDLHLRDLEFLVRSYAMLVNGENYSPSLVKFINKFSKDAKRLGPDESAFMKSIGTKFFDESHSLPAKAFFNRKTNRFNVPFFEAVFVASCREALTTRDASKVRIKAAAVERLHTDARFIEATQLHTTGTAKVKDRIRRAVEVFAETP